MKLILTHEEYMDLLEKTGIKDLMTNLIQKSMEDKIGNLLDKRESSSDLVIKKAVTDIFPIESSVRNSKYLNIVTAGYSSWINAFSAMQQPEHFAKVINLVNKELKRTDGLEYEIGDPKFKMLGLANRYAENAAECKLLYKWNDYNKYMNLLVYFLPFLVDQAGLSEKDIEKALSSKVEARLSQEIGKNTDHHHLYYVSDKGTGFHLSHDIPNNEVRVIADYNMGYTNSFSGGDFEKLKSEIDKFTEQTGKQLEEILKKCGYKKV